MVVVRFQKQILGRLILVNREKRWRECIDLAAAGRARLFLRHGVGEYDHLGVRCARNGDLQDLGRKWGPANKTAHWASGPDPVGLSSAGATLICGPVGRGGAIENSTAATATMLGAHPSSAECPVAPRLTAKGLSGI